MEFQSIRSKPNEEIQNTRPSNNQSSYTQKHQLSSIQSLIEESSTVNFAMEITDSKIKFVNGWVYQGQHYNCKFHGWGQLYSSDDSLIYKGSFQNGYFHKYGRVINNEMFSYIICEKTLKKFISQALLGQNNLKNDLKQIQVTNPFKGNKDQPYSFGKNKKDQQLFEEKPQCKNYKFSKFSKIITVEWLKYTGQFLQGNATGFGTVKVLVCYQSEKHVKQHQVKKQIFYVNGKFLNGKIDYGTIKN